jgi:arginine utilization protein RocB
MGNVLLMISPHHETAHKGAIQCHERLGDLLKYYAREAA